MIIDVFYNAVNAPQIVYYKNRWSFAKLLFQNCEYAEGMFSKQKEHSTA